MDLQQRAKTIISIIVMVVIFFTMVFYQVKSAVPSVSLEPELNSDKIPKFVNQLVVPPVFDPEVKVEGKGKV